MKIPEVVTEAVESPRAAGKLNQFRLDEHGREILDSRPMEPPVGYVKRESISDQIRRMVLQVSQEIASNEVESVEEANDFYVEDDPGSALPGSQYEFDEDYVLEQQLAARRRAADEVSVVRASEVKDEPKPLPEPKGGSGGQASA